MSRRSNTFDGAGSSLESSEADEGNPGPDQQLESADATPESSFTGAASSMPPPSASASPRYTAARPVPTKRVLPSREVTDESIADAYASFILYSNPYFALDIDTSELKRIFRTPPRSDGKDFSIYTLWELIKRFDSKDIKTWTQLALELGVEPPSVEKGGSVQKVQQYSVRLKRWMRAMHVDAFFEYLLGKKHTYFLDLPPPHDPHPARGRDGVPADEDLAIRALDPSFRPKRGRKRNETPEEDHTPPKKPLLTTSFSYEGRTLYAQPQSAHPSTAIPLSVRRDNFNHDPWALASGTSSASGQMAPYSAIAIRPPQHLQWPMHGTNDTPITPHPMSAIETRAPGYPIHEEARSAITPSSPRSKIRRKHGPAVSSAWTGGNTSNNAKPRGRPPGNRSVQDGPFNMFPVDPNAEKSPSGRTNSVSLIPWDTEQHLLRPQTYMQPLHHRSQNSTPQSATIPPTDDDQQQRRPERGRLSLQVPEHTGGPVHLATPTLLLNGESSNGSSQGPAPTSVDSDSRAGSETRPVARSSGTPQTADSQTGLAFEALKRVLAADLLKSNISGRSSRLSGNEAVSLADAILERFGVPRADSDNKNDDALRISAISWLCVSRQLGFTSSAPCREKEIVAQRYAVRHDGTEEAIGPDVHADRIKEKFDISWTAGFGGVGGKFCVVGLEIGPQRVDFEDPEYRANQIIKNVAANRDAETDWKGKFMALDMTVRLMKGQLNRLQDKVLDAVL